MLRPVHIKSLEDHELVTRYKESTNQEYVGMLYKRYLPMIFGVCMKYLKNEAESDDAVMEIYERLVKDLLKHEVSHFKSWLYMVSKNHCLMQLRKKQTDIKRLHDCGRFWLIFGQI